MIKRIKKYDEIFENCCYNKTCKELGIEKNTYRAYVYTIESKGDILTFDDTLLNSNVKDIAKSLRKYNIHMIALTNCDVSLLTEFNKYNIVVDSMTQVITPYKDWDNDSYRMKDAIVLKVVK